MNFRVLLVALAIAAHANGDLFANKNNNSPCISKPTLVDHRSVINTIGPISLDLTEVDEWETETPVFSTEDWTFATVSIFLHHQIIFLILYSSKQLLIPITDVMP